jgi:hypothetical protein
MGDWHGLTGRRGAGGATLAREGRQRTESAEEFCSAPNDIILWRVLCWTTLFSDVSCVERCYFRMPLTPCVERYYYPSPTPEYISADLTLVVSRTWSQELSSPCRSIHGVPTVFNPLICWWNEIVNPRPRASCDWYTTTRDGNFSTTSRWLYSTCEWAHTNLRQIRSQLA